MELPVVNHPDYEAKIGDDNKFPIKKFSELASYLKKEKVVNKFYKPEPCSIDTLKQVHSEEYIAKIINKTLEERFVKKIGFPLVDSIVRRSLVATGGTVLASKLAINYGIACNTAGGSHHANYNEGAGYCIFNDVAVAAKYLTKRGLAQKILILDLDVHQGNGSADIFKDENNIFTFSMHTKVNYPPIKSKSDLDIEVEQNMEDAEYLDILNKNLIFLNDFNFDFVFYIAGVDIHINDRLGKLKVSEKGIKIRDDMVIKSFFKKKIPICGVLGGGYNTDFKKLIELHSSLHKTCAKYLNDKK